MDKIAFPKLALNFSKTGSPIPDGIPVIWHSTTPPTESCSFIFSSNNCSTFFAAFASGIHTGLFKISSRLKFSSTISIPPIFLLYAKISIPSEANNFFATAPAATLPIVSLPEERPPPL